jgi:hypothetical protein
MTAMLLKTADSTCCVRGLRAVIEIGSVTIEPLFMRMLQHELVMS